MVNKYNLRLFLVIILVAGSFFCRTTDLYNLPVQSIEKVYLDDIKDLLAQKETLKALQYIDFLSREKKTDADELEALKNQAVDILIKDFNQAVSASQYRKAFFFYISLRTVSAESALFPEAAAKILNDQTEKSLLLQDAVVQAAAHNYLLATSDYFRIMENYPVTPAEINLISAFIAEYDAPNLSYLSLILKEKYKQDLPAEYRELLTRELKPATLLKGTVIVQVDQGMDISHGTKKILLGSGFFIDKRGYILTNYHVIASEVDPEYNGYSRMNIIIPEKSTSKIPAKVVGWDRILDIALLKVEVEPEYIFSLSYNFNYEPGSKVFAIGNPVHTVLANTITAGIISATHRRGFLQLGDVLQVDASINPGNSGGPLLNEKYNVIGIVFAGIEQFEGLNFAIPSHWVIDILPKLFDGGEVKHPWLGAAVIAESGGLEILYNLPGEPTSYSGMREQDIIREINGRPLNDLMIAQDLLLNIDVNTLLPIVWERGGEMFRGMIALNVRPIRPFELALQRDSKINVLTPLFGLKLKRIGTKGNDYSVVRVIKDSVADSQGIKPNDNISIFNWMVDPEKKLVVVQMYLKKQQEGFFKSAIQLVSYLESDLFL